MPRRLVRLGLQLTAEDPSLFEAFTPQLTPINLALTADFAQPLIDTIEGQTKPNISPRTLIEVAGSLLDLDEAAARESWRKEVYRPIYHTHKWWAQRLGSVFRGLLIAALSGPETSLAPAFTSRLNFDGAVVYDPFMGSGTTVGEAYKLGCTVIGQDINPVPCAPVSLMFNMPTKDRLNTEFERLTNKISPNIQMMYRSTASDGANALGLYYFWVKVIKCPACFAQVPLFSTFVFAKHAYSSRFPKAKAICISCYGIADVLLTDQDFDCKICGKNTVLSRPPARGSKVSCTICRYVFDIQKTYQLSDGPPDHMMYAKIVLDTDGTKTYASVTEADRSLYSQQSAAAAVVRQKLREAKIDAGYNTNQVIRYNYRNWHEFFNNRQLVALDSIATEIQSISDSKVRLALGVLFSGTLEFNNMFASFKGEGTGAVRHMFSHHILKPERMPLEANVWGSTKSSGSFSTLYPRRLLRAIEYGSDPWDLELKNSRSRVYGISKSFRDADLSQSANGSNAQRSVSVRCGDSQRVNLENQSVDLILTDPPFFNNVHYSELADFFWTWQRQYGLTGIDVESGARSTRHPSEVQSTDHTTFAKRLGLVFSECRRVLKRTGLLVFTYHHSDNQGWLALADALESAQFYVVQSHSVKSEMSIATPKTGSKTPIDRDIVIVARFGESQSNHAEFKKQLIADDAWTRFEIDLAMLNVRLASKIDAWNLLASKVLVSIMDAPDRRVTCEWVFAELNARFIKLFAEADNT